MVGFPKTKCHKSNMSYYVESTKYTRVQHHQTIHNIDIFWKLITSLYQLPKKTRLICFGNHLDGCMVCFPKQNIVMSNMPHSINFWIYMHIKSSSYAHYLFFPEKPITSLYWWFKKNRLMCFENNPNSLISGFPTTKWHKVKYSMFC